jgi:hypothetical protein
MTSMWLAREKTMSDQGAFGRARLLGLAAVTVVVAGLVTYLVVRVPIAARHPPDPALQQHRLEALVLYVLMALADIAMVLMIRASLRARGTPSVTPPPPRTSRAASPLRLTFDHVSPSSVLVTAGVSIVVLIVSAAVGLPIWAVAALTLLPWVPVYFTVARWQYRQFGLYAVFGGIVLLQLGHLSEHVAQNIELIASHGNVKTSLGVFGALDQEAVHFFWNLLILAGTAFLLGRFGRRNPWLWISFFVASFHGVEHFYLYWLYLTDHANYLLAASPGIFAKGGLVGSPLARPYLHLVYNYIEIIPFLLAFWDGGRTLPDRSAAPGPTRAQAAATS